MPTELPILTVANAALWRQWLSREHAVSKGVWLTLAKKGIEEPTSLTWQEAIEEAMCFGWIDGQSRKRDEVTWAIRFQPRAAKSMWSKRNVGIVEQLEKTGRMTDIGRVAIDAAKADGRWDKAYAGSANAEAPADFLAALSAVPSAQATHDELNKQNRYAIYFRLNSLKTPAGREKRIQAFVDMLAKGDTPIPRKKSEKSKAERVQALPEVKRDSPARQTRSGRKAPGRYKD